MLAGMAQRLEFDTADQAGLFDTVGDEPHVSARSKLLALRLPSFLAGESGPVGGAPSTCPPARRTVLDFVRRRVAAWYEAGCPPVEPKGQSWHLCPNCRRGFSPETVPTSAAVPVEHHDALVSSAVSAECGVGSLIKALVWNGTPEELESLQSEVRKAAGAPDTAEAA